MPIVAMFLTVFCGAGAAASAGVAGSEVAAPAPPKEEHPHALYVDLLGKGGLVGLGYDVVFKGRLSAGATLSFGTFDGQSVVTVSPYLGLNVPLQREHRWFVHAGPQWMRLSTRSPVPEWSGTSASRLGGQVSLGYEYRGPLLLRAYGMLAVGEKGIAPWAGLSVGKTFP